MMNKAGFFCWYASLPVLCAYALAGVRLTDLFLAVPLAARHHGIVSWFPRQMKHRMGFPPNFIHSLDAESLGFHFSGGLQLPVRQSTR